MVNTVKVVTFAIATFGLARNCGILSLLSKNATFLKVVGKSYHFFPLKGPKAVHLLARK